MLLRVILAEHPFLRGLPPPVLAAIASLAREARMESRHFLIRTGDPADKFYLIREGSVAVVTYGADGAPMVLQTLAAGDILGWSWLVPPHAYRFDAYVVEPVAVFVLDGAELRRLCRVRPELGVEVLQRLITVITARLDAARRRLAAPASPARTA